MNTNFNFSFLNIKEQKNYISKPLRKHYLLPEIEEQFYTNGSVGKIKI